MGPVGILCIRRTLSKGRIYGLATGAGAALSDIIYALLTGAGMAFAVNIIENPTNIYWLKLIGAVVLFCFGLYLFRALPKPAPESHRKGNGTLLSNFFTAFLLTLSNPLIIFLFLATFNMFTFVIPHHWLAQTLGYLSIVGGAMLWWAGLTGVLVHMNDRLGANFARTLNRTIGGLVIAGSIITIIKTLFDPTFLKFLG
ncbi:MAG: LysE family transporter [Bacteroidales bacterium]|nr:LysE family transporter [Candidatus Equimonas faecalis]